MTDYEKLIKAHDKLLNEWKSGKPVKPLYVYALDPNYLSDDVCKIIKDNIGKIAAWTAKDNSCVIASIALALILYQTRIFFEKGDGRNYWSCLDIGQNRDSRQSPFGWALGVDSGRDKNKAFIVKDYIGYIQADERLRELGIHDDQQLKENEDEGIEAYDYFVWFLFNCPFLSTEEAGVAAGRLENNKKVKTDPIIQDFLSNLNWVQLCDLHDNHPCQLQQMFSAVAGKFINRNIANDNEYDDSLDRLGFEKAYIHALLKYAPLEYLLSLKALVSDSGKDSDEYGACAKTWPWLEQLWGKAPRPKVRSCWVFEKGNHPQPRLLIDADTQLRGYFYQASADEEIRPECEELEWVYHIPYFNKFDMHQSIMLHIENDREYEIPPLYPSPDHQFIFFHRRAMQGGCTKLSDGSSARSFCLVYPAEEEPYSPELVEGEGVCTCVETSEHLERCDWRYAVYDLPISERQEVEVHVKGVQGFHIALRKPTSLQTDYDQELFEGGRAGAQYIIVVGTEVPVLIDGQMEMPEGLALDDAGNQQKIKLLLENGGAYYKLYHLKRTGKMVLFLPVDWQKDTQRVSNVPLETAVAYARKALEAFQVQVLNENGDSEELTLTRSRTVPLWVWSNISRPSEYSQGTKTSEEAQDYKITHFPNVWYEKLAVGWHNLSTGNEGVGYFDGEGSFSYTAILDELYHKNLLQHDDKYRVSFGGLCVLEDTWSPLRLEGKILCFPPRCRSYRLRIRHELYYRSVFRKFRNGAPVETKWEFSDALYRVDSRNLNRVDLAPLMDGISKEDGYWQIDLIGNHSRSKSLYIEPEGNDILQRWGLLGQEDALAAYAFSRMPECSELKYAPDIAQVLQAATAKLWPEIVKKVLDPIFKENHELAKYDVDSTSLLKTGFARQGNTNHNDMLPIYPLFPLNVIEKGKHVMLQAVTVTEEQGAKVVHYWKTGAFVNDNGSLRRESYANAFKKVRISPQTGHVEFLPPFAKSTCRDVRQQLALLAGNIIEWLPDVPDAVLAHDSASEQAREIIDLLYGLTCDEAEVIKKKLRSRLSFAPSSLSQLLYALVLLMEAEGPNQPQPNGTRCAHFFLGAIELLLAFKSNGNYTPHERTAYVFELAANSRDIRHGIAKCLYLLFWLDTFFSTH